MQSRGDPASDRCRSGNEVLGSALAIWTGKFLSPGSLDGGRRTRDCRDLPDSSRGARQINRPWWLSGRAGTGNSTGSVLLHAGRAAESRVASRSSRFGPNADREPPGNSRTACRCGHCRTVHRCVLSAAYGNSPAIPRNFGRGGRPRTILVGVGLSVGGRAVLAGVALPCRHGRGREGSSYIGR